ncbi:MAG: alpha/beta hydrolase [Planctomycetales bacterium]|nr:alpha/beta hydrolase [Planctomycetales bacterium]
MARWVCPLLCVAMIGCLSVRVGSAQERPAPTFADVAYGEHENQRIDFWQAEADDVAPLAIFIHGGGFERGSKRQVDRQTLRDLLAAGVHVAAVEYRFIPDAPLPAAHRDAARALQFLRSKAAEWGIDPTRIGGFGGSAGAQLVAFLAFHDDMADPASDDPIARESTRLSCVAPLHCQSTMDLAWWVANIPGYREPHRDPHDYFGQLDDADMADVVREVSVINHITADDPPVYMLYRMPPDEPFDDSKDRGWAVHHVRFGEAMKQRLDQAGVEAVLVYPGANVAYTSAADFLIRQLKSAQN